MAALLTVVLLAGCSSSHHAQQHPVHSTIPPRLVAATVAWATSRHFRPGTLSAGQVVVCGGRTVGLGRKVPPPGGSANGFTRNITPANQYGAKHWWGQINIRSSLTGVVVVQCTRQEPVLSLGVPLESK